MKKNKFLCGLTAASIFIGASLGAFTASAASETNYTLEELFAMSDEEFLALDTAQELYETVKKDAENVEQTPNFTEYGGISGDLYVDVVTMGEKSYTANITESDIENLLGDSVKYDMYSPKYSMITDDAIVYDYLLWITLPELKKEYDEVSDVDILNMTKTWYCVNQVIDITYNPCHNLLDRPTSNEQGIAESGNILDVRDNLVLTISNKTTGGGSHELWIDNSYRYLIADICKLTATVRMTDGTVPPSAGEGKDQYVKKLTNVQKANLLCIETVWFTDTDIKLSDDLYIVKGFKSADETEKYCQQLIEEGKADYAQPIVTGTYRYCYPAGDLLSYFNGIGIEYDTAKSDEIAAFSEDLLIFCMCCKDESSTIEFLNKNVDGFEERVYAAVECDSKIYFQLKSGGIPELKDEAVNVADEADNVKVLEQLSALENFTKPGVIKYAALVGDNPETQINSIPDNYKSGDVNMDENIDLYDAIRIAESMAKLKTLTDVEFVLADLDDNGKVDLYDAIEVANIMLNK